MDKKISNFKGMIHMSKYTLDNTFLYMALMTLPLIFIMPVLFSVPLVLLIFSIKKKEN